MGKHKHQGKAVYSQPKACHTNGTLIFERNGTKYYAGRYTHVSEKNYDLIIDLAKMVTATIKGTNLRGGLAEFADSYAAQILHIDWPDYDVINWKRERFEHLLSAIDSDNLDSVYVCCVGGHGRTGTMMSILATLSGAVPEGECPVMWLRNKYCDNVVESDTQIEYVENITGRKVKASESKHIPVYSKGGAYPFADNYSNQQSGWYNRVYGSGVVTQQAKKYDGTYGRPNS